MAEGSELGDSGRPGAEEIADDEAPTSFVDILPADSRLIRNKEASLGDLSGDFLANARRELLKTKVNAFLKVVAARDGLLPVVPHIYDEFVLGEDGRTLYLKEGLKQVTWKMDSTKYLVLRKLGAADFIRTRLFPDYITTRAKPTEQ